MAPTEGDAEVASAKTWIQDNARVGRIRSEIARASIQSKKIPALRLKTGRLGA